MARVLVKSIAVPAYNEATGTWTMGLTANPSNSVIVVNNGYITSSTSDAADNRSMTISGGGGGTAWNQNRGAGIVMQGNEVSGAEGEMVYYAGNAGGTFSRHRWVASGVDVLIISKDGSFTFGVVAVTAPEHRFNLGNSGTGKMRFNLNNTLDAYIGLNGTASGILDYNLNHTFGGITGTNSANAGGTFRIDSRDTGGSNLFSFHARGLGDALNVDNVVMSITAAGACALGPNTANNNVTVNGSLTTTAGAAGSSYIQVRNGFQDNAHILLNQVHTANGRTWAIKPRMSGGFTSLVIARSNAIDGNLDGDTGYTSFGVISDLGACKLGVDTNTGVGLDAVSSTGAFGRISGYGRICYEATGTVLSLTNTSTFVATLTHQNAFQSMLIEIVFGGINEASSASMYYVSRHHVHHNTGNIFSDATIGTDSSSGCTFAITHSASSVLLLTITNSSGQTIRSASLNVRVISLGTDSSAAKGLTSITFA
jgi:hypothetical protein